MTTWVVLLRAVNVGGTAKLPMEVLRSALTEAGFTNVRTYFASGNFVLEADADAEEIRTRVDAILNNQFGISGARSIVRDGVVFRRVLKSNPFRDAAQHRPDQLHVHFLAAQPLVNAETNLTSYKGGERLRLDGQQLYIDYGNGVGQSALTARFLETAVGCSGTSRNWNTVLKLVEMMERK